MNILGTLFFGSFSEKLRMFKGFVDVGVGSLLLNDWQVIAIIYSVKFQTYFDDEMTIAGTLWSNLHIKKKF